MQRSRSFMVASGFLSMWITNVTVTLLMLPIALAIADKEDPNGKSSGRFSLALMLAIAHASCIGGASSLIGTPPNLVLAGTLSKLFPESPEITFFYWLKIGLPVLIVLLPITWLYLIKHFNINGCLAGSDEIIRQEYKALGTMSKGEKRVLAVFIFTVLGWIFRKDIQIDDVVIPGWSNLLENPKMAHDSTVAILSLLVLFSLNGNEKGQRLLDWKTASTIPWGIMAIVGGGFALASGFKATQLPEWIGKELSYIGSLPLFLMIALVITVVTFLTEINSNTATANIFLPILGALATTAKINPLLLMLPAVFACSLSFMLPSGTATNMVIFASERVTIPQMARCGLWLNLITILVLTLLFYFILIPFAGINPALPNWAK